MFSSENMKISPKEQVFILLLVAAIIALYFITANFVLPGYAPSDPEAPLDFCGNGFCGLEEECSQCLADCGVCPEYNLIFLDSMDDVCTRITKTEFVCEPQGELINLVLIFFNAGNSTLHNITVQSVCGIPDNNILRNVRMYNFLYAPVKATLNETGFVTIMQPKGYVQYEVETSLGDVFQKNVCTLSNEKANISCTVTAQSAEGAKATVNILMRVDASGFEKEGC
jgi:hypothetical protein